MACAAGRACSLYGGAFRYVVAAMMLGLAGCRAGSGQFFTGPQISPDGKTIAYARSSYAGSIGVVRDVHARPISYSAELVLVNAESPEKVRRVRYAAGVSPGPDDWRIEMVRFSPSGERVLVGSRGFRPAAVSAADGKICKLDLGHGLQTWSTVAAGWRGESELVYVLYGDDVFEIYRQGLDEPVAARKLVYREAGERLHEVVFSPNGEWVLLKAAIGTDQPYQLLETGTGRLRTIALPASTNDKVSAVDVAWRPDGRMVALVFHLLPVVQADGKEAGTHEALVVFEATGDEPAEQIRQQMTLRSRAVIGWTAEGKYLVLDSHGLCALIQPEPWQVISLMEKLKPLRPKRPAGEFCRVTPLPVAGWLRVADWRKRPAEGEAVNFVAADYALERLVPLGALSDGVAGGHWAVSPNGDYVAVLDEGSGRVVVKGIGEGMGGLRGQD